MGSSRSTRTFGAARRHSRLVRSLKFVIPIGAALAVSGVLVATVYNPFGRLPGLSVGPVSLSGSKIAMESPRLTGFRKDTRPYEVTATAAFQDIRKPNVIELKEMKARLTTDAAGSVTHLVATTGVLDTGKDHLELSEDIRVRTDRGDEMTLRSASVDLKAGAVLTREPVKITTPTMTLDAEGMDLSDGGKKIVFSGRVRTILKRDPERGPAEGQAVAEASVAGPPVVPGGTPARVSQAEAGGRR